MRFLAAILLASCVPAFGLRVSDNGRFLVCEDGKPFFWLGDTAWALFYRLNREEADRYLVDRKSKQFNVIQAVILGGSTTEPNAYGHCALLSKDPAKPNEPYFEHVDWVVNRAASLGFHVALLPTWGENVIKSNSIFNADNARQYGEFLGRRYRKQPVIWVLGGDQNAPGFEAVWRAMAAGLAAGHGGRHLMTYHPRGGASSGQWFHNEPWLAFNMIQSGHTRVRPAATDRLLLVRRDYARTPAKPVIDAESVYENIPEGLSKGGKRDPFDVVPANERITDHDVRVAAYGTVFSGAFGYTYGGNGVFQMTKTNMPASQRWNPQRTWEQALQLPGASQMQHLRALIESFPILPRVPAPDLVDGKGCVATRGTDGSYAMVYSPSGKPFKVRMNKKIKASWFDPRNGKMTVIGEFAIAGEREFTPPTSGENNDWVLVLAEITSARLKVSDNHRFLVHEDGKPFFYLGDTAWELFHCLTREEADLYLRTRAEQRFTVIQAVVLAEFDGLRLPNAYGHLPLRNDDPTQPVEDYFQHVDWITRRANELGLWIGMLPTWGDKWNKRWGKGPEIFTPQNARAYGEWLARRYRDAKIIWILGGDRAIETDAQREIIRAMAAGLRAGDGGAHLITFHPSGGRHSADMVHDEPWLDFNMIQSGHAEKNIANYDKLARDYNRTPTKPCMDAEPCYENHPVRKKKEQGWFNEWDARKLCYWALFAGAHGHTYGCHDIWSFHDPAKNRRFVDQRTPWQEAIHLPGANQMRHARALMESRPFLTRIPDQSLVVGDTDIRATRDANGSYAMVYSPTGKPFKVRMDKKVKASWFNPRTGKTIVIGEFAIAGEREFTPPTSGENNDWVLMLDDAETKSKQ